MEKISDKDRAIIDVATLEKKIAQLQLEIAELKYTNKILNVYINNGLTVNHVITPEGNVVLNEKENK